MWGQSLCGPIALADGATRTWVTNQPAPSAPPPPALGYANTAVEWGGTRWTTVVWPLIPTADAKARARLLLHELFHRIQPQLGLLGPEGQNPHVDTTDGRYWLQLEWRALARALRTAGPESTAALGDALAFRFIRHEVFPGSVEHERRLEINEGLAQYTGTVVAAGTSAAAIEDVLGQLERAAAEPTFVRTFPYATGAAYGVLLDRWSPGWTRQVTGDDNLARRLMAATGISPSVDVVSAAERYGGPELRVAEERRDLERRARLSELRRVFVEGPVVRLPRANNATFVTTGMTPIPGTGTLYTAYRVKAEWGSLEASRVVVSEDRTTLVLSAPMSADGPVVSGDGWTLVLAPGWALRPADRQGDLRLLKAPQ